MRRALLILVALLALAAVVGLGAAAHGIGGATPALAPGPPHPREQLAPPQRPGGDTRESREPRDD